MSNTQNIALEMMHKWSKQMQDCTKDPKLMEYMAQYYEKYQEVINDWKNKTEVSTDESCDDDAGDIILKLEMRIEQLEARIAILEKFIAATN